MVDRIRQAGGEAEFVALDVTDEQSGAHAIEPTVARFGVLTTLVNNAAPTAEVAGAIKRLADYTTEEWDRILLGTLTGNVFWASRFAIPHIAAAGGGSIINLRGSFGGRLGRVRRLRGSQGGHEQRHPIDRSRRGTRHIRCYTIIVGRVVAKGYTLQAVTGDEHPTRLGVPDDIAYAATWLASDESEFVTGSEVTVDGGFTINRGIHID